MNTVDSPHVDSSPTGDGFSASSFLQIGIMSTTVLDRFLDPVTDCLTPAVAERIVGVRVDAQTQRRLDELAEKAKARKVLERRVG